MKRLPFDSSACIAYAKKWAYRRNPNYYNFDGMGGDCTNFASQCLVAGGAVMNFTPVFGWYYNSLSDRAPAWSGVEEFYRFLINNRSAGPLGREISPSAAEEGDIIQLGNSKRFYHTLICVAVKNYIPYVAAHTYDTFMTPLTAYDFERIRAVRVGYVQI